MEIQNNYVESDHLRSNDDASEIISPKKIDQNKEFLKFAADISNWSPKKIATIIDEQC